MTCIPTSSFAAMYIQGCLAVSRAFGDRTLQPYVIADPHIHNRSLEPDRDMFMYLVSDGVTGKHIIKIVPPNIKAFCVYELASILAWSTLKYLLSVQTALRESKQFDSIPSTLCVSGCWFPGLFDSKVSLFVQAHCLMLHYIWPSRQCSHGCDMPDCWQACKLAASLTCESRAVMRCAVLPHEISILGGATIMF
jgi:hypothetical protein